ncbi:MAG: hypothetical protein ACOY94_18710 [Bacillota bacterium]
MAETEERIRQLEARKQTLGQQLRQQERRERTRRLIQIGAVMSKLGVDSLERAQSLQREVERRQQVREWLHRVIGRAGQIDQDSGVQTNDEGAQE